jgi:5,5'-dehydrodivanillate O-demethylase
MQLDEPLGAEEDISARFYDRTGPDAPAGKYFRRFWQPIALLDDVKPGRAKSIQVMGERFTYYRGESGAPHLTVSQCPHRHTKLAPQGIVENDCIRCYYHGWTFDETGQCVAQPAEGARSFAHKVKIRAYPIRQWLGIVFAYLGDGEPPAFHEIDLYSGPGHLAVWSYIRNCNIFNTMDNAADWAHVAFVHRRSEFRGFNREIPAISAEETEFGLSSNLLYSDGVRGAYYVLMPHAMNVFGMAPRPPGYGEGGILRHQLAFRVAIDDNSHRSYNIEYYEVYGEEAKAFAQQRRADYEKLRSLPSFDDMLAALYRGDIHIEEIDEDRPDLIGLQDTVTMCQQDLISAREPDRLGSSDVGVILLRKLYTREIRKMLAGEPLKPWTWPRDLRAVAPLP